MWDRWGNLGILVVIVGLVFAVAARPLHIAPFDQPPIWYATFLPIVVGLAMAFYGFAARRLVYVQCYPKYLRIQTPLFPLTMSYKRIEGTRVVQVARVFDIEQEKKARNSWPEKYWGMTAIAIDVKKLPPNVSESWLKLWFDRYLFNPRRLGFILLIDDWQGLSNQLNGYIADYRLQRSKRL
jgi:hypothetical protein